MQWDIKAIVTVVGLAGAIASPIGTWFVMKSDIDLLKEDVATLVSKNKEQDKTIQDVRLKAATDSVNLNDVKEDVQEIKVDVKELLKR